MPSRTEERGQLRGGLWIKQTPSVYTTAQVSEWLAKIKYPKINYPEDITSFEPSLESLTLLARLSITTFPFENTPMHYTADHAMDITYDSLYDRMVAASDGRGSYCFGLNRLFFQMIKALGFRAYAGAGRVNEEPPNVAPIFHSFCHMLLFVQPIEGSNKTYVVDVAAGPVRPILLEEGELVTGASPSEHHLLTRAAHPHSSLESYPDSQGSEKLEWRLEHLRNSDDPDQSASSRVMYSFIEDEFFEVDFAAFNYSVDGLQAGLFWENVVCTKFFWMTDDEVREVDKGISGIELATLTPLTRHLVRLSMAGNKVRRHVGMQSTVLRVTKTEEERAQALREFFAIGIAHGDLKHIEGREAEL
ncbi:hypothetical protein C8F04DRAFT_1004580 [Mycena alexandri]|uniref:Arylamine N-acetyltransferase n=1 Tax=Mycena alexandri TaxID=1745969 RepID=A0AAD6X1U4_9AGAR|nr:hypothetical protein C8F04DRAFT_1004580 [Mycena alexandri]